MKKKSRVKRILPLLLITIGVLCIATALIIEANRFPWRTYLHMEREAEAIPDPAPIVLSGEDRGISIVEGDPLTPEEAYELLPGSELDDAPPEVYILLGVMKIPKLEVSQYILEGTQRQMRYGGGHYIGSAGIGEKGNCVISAHRPQAFRYLDLLEDGDIVVMKAKENIYTYTVYESFIVEPTELWVLDPVEDEDYALTMITCTPFMVSSHRLIVRARLTDINGENPDAFYEKTQENINLDKGS